MIGGRVLLREPVKQRILQKRRAVDRVNAHINVMRDRWKTSNPYQKAELKKTDWIGLGHIKHNVIFVILF